LGWDFHAKAMKQPDQLIGDGAEFFLLAFQARKEMGKFAPRQLGVCRDFKGWNLMGGVHFGLSCANALFDV